MALILLDGMEDRSSWTTPGSTTIQPGRYNSGLLMPSFDNLGYRLQTSQEADTLTMGFAFRVNILPSSSVELLIFQSDNGGTDHMKLYLYPDGSMGATRGFSNLQQTISGLITPNIFYYVEFQSKLHDTTGNYAVKLNGTTVLTGTNVDTKNGGTKTVYDRVLFRTSNNTMVLDDVYLSNDATFLGALTVETIYPNGNGDTSAWSGSDGNSINNYDIVDEVGNPNTADYVFSNTVGQQDLYQLSNLVHTDGTIVGVCHSAYVASTDAVTPPNIKLLNRRAATNASAVFPLTTAYRSYDYVLTQDPETGAAYTIANVNALQSGVELA